MRGFWDAAIAEGNGVTVEEEAENGSVTGPILMGLADEIVSGTKTTEAAVAEARTAIATATGSTLDLTLNAGHALALARLSAISASH